MSWQPALTCPRVYAGTSTGVNAGYQNVQAGLPNFSSPKLKNMGRPGYEASF